MFSVQVFRLFLGDIRGGRDTPPIYCEIVSLLRRNRNVKRLTFLLSYLINTYKEN